MKTAIVAGIVAMLVSAASGTAAFVVTSKNIKNGTIQTIDISAKAKQALKGNRGPRGYRGANGINGLNGAPGLKGDKGDKGDTGSPWPVGAALPSGKTLRGVYAPGAFAAAADEFEQEAISFGFILPAKPVAHYIGFEDPAPAECPGSVTSPAAAAGHLCVYESVVTNAGTRFVFNPVDDAVNESATRGFGIYVESASAGAYWVQGSWAVTAP